MLLITPAIYILSEFFHNNDQLIIKCQGHIDDLSALFQHLTLYKSIAEPDHDRESGGKIEGSHRPEMQGAGIQIISGLIYCIKQFPLNEFIRW